MCLTVQVVWQVEHSGCGSCFKMKEWVSLVWPIRNRDIKTCSLLDFLDASLHSPMMGWIWKSLLWMLLLHCCCHFVWKNLLIVGFRSVYGILDLSGVRSKADLAAESIIIIIKSYWQHGFPWLSLSIRLYHLLLSAGLLNYILCLQWCKQILVGRPILEHPWVGVHRRMSLMSSSLVLLQCPSGHFRFASMTFEMGD